MIYVGFMDCMVRQFRFDQDKGLLEKVKEIQPHLDAVKNISLNGKLDLCVSSSRVLKYLLILY